MDSREATLGVVLGLLIVLVFTSLGVTLSAPGHRAASVEMRSASTAAASGTELVAQRTRSRPVRVAAAPSSPLTADRREELSSSGHEEFETDDSGSGRDD